MVRAWNSIVAFWIVVVVRVGVEHQRTWNTKNLATSSLVAPICSNICISAESCDVLHLYQATDGEMS